METRRTVLVVVVALALAVSALGLAGCNSTVPDLRGRTKVQARADLKEVGLKLGKIAYDRTVVGADGQIVDQKPAARSGAKGGTLVSVTIAGPPPVKVPSLIEKTREGAEAALARAGLKLGAVTKTFSDVAVGRVALQTPGARDEALPGSAVDVALSTGPAPIQVPDVADMTFDQATTVLKNRSFLVARVDLAGTGGDANTVADQDPEGDDRAVPGTTVRLSVWTGKPPVAGGKPKAPFVKGLGVTQAKRTLKALKINVRVVAGPGNGVAAPGVVYKQTPIGGTDLAPGDTVTLYTAPEADGTPYVDVPPPVTVPWVRGLPVADAKTTLESLDLKWEVVYGPGNGLAESGTVYDQSPISGERVEAESVVKITIMGQP